jgi:signal transduction histidine kinase/CheY-like chemotaxis protein
MRIRSRLLLLVIAILLPAMIGACLGIYYVYSKQRDTYRESIKDLSYAMALLLDKEFSARVRTLQMLSRSPTITDNNLSSFYRFADEVAVNWDTVIVLSDSSGAQFLNTRSPWGTRNLPKITPSLLAKRKQQGPDAPLVSDIYYAPLGKQHSFAVQVPVERDGRVLYYLTMGTFTRQLQTLLEEQKLPQGWIATILDRQGVVAARSQEPEKFIGAKADETLANKIRAMGQGTNDGITFDGRPVTAFFSRAPQSEWSIVISVPLSVLNGPAVQATAFLAGIALLLLGVGLGAAAVIARKTAKPMEDLRQAAIDLGQGKVIARQSSGVVEIDAVSLEMARANEQILSSKAELERRVADAVATAEQSQKTLLQSQKLEALGRLTGGIAHDFNNIMQTLTTGLQLALLSPIEPRIKQTLEACQRAVERATELTRQLMAFGRVQEAHLETLRLDQRIGDIFPLLKGALPSNIELQIDIEENLWPVTIDPMQLELALLNVTINARDAMSNGGVICLTMRNASLARLDNELAAGNYVSIAITDSGEGMTADVLTNALDPFFTTKPVGKGSGMGLPQAYGFARQVGGTLVIRSAPGKGTTIMFYIPRAESVLSARAPMQSATERPRTKATGRLLFVEDDILVAAVVAPALKTAGFEVVEADNVEKALDLLQSQGPFDVVFSDIVMPGKLTGIDLAERVLKHFPDTRVVLATGYSERQLAVAGVEILPKPYVVADAVEILSTSPRTDAPAES